MVGARLRPAASKVPARAEEHFAAAQVRMAHAQAQGRARDSVEKRSPIDRAGSPNRWRWPLGRLERHLENRAAAACADWGLSVMASSPSWIRAFDRRRRGRGDDEAGLISSSIRVSALGAWRNPAPQGRRDAAQQGPARAISHGSRRRSARQAQPARGGLDLTGALAGPKAARTVMRRSTARPATAARPRVSTTNPCADGRAGWRQGNDSASAPWTMFF